MRIKIRFADLKNQLFMEGTNLSTKLYCDEGKQGGNNSPKAVDMQFDTVWQCLIVEYKDKVSMVPFPAINSMMPFDVTDVAEKKKLKVVVVETKPEQGAAA